MLCNLQGPVLAVVAAKGTLPRILKQKVWKDPRLEPKINWNCNESPLSFVKL